MASRVERPPWRRRRRRQHQHRPPPRQLLRSQYPPSPCPASPGSTAHPGLSESADLEDPRQLDAMLAARASARKDVVITILGPTSGTRAIRMEEEMGESFVLNLLSTLASVGVTNTLPITTHLHTPSHPGNNLCLQRLRKRGVCCAYSGVGMGLVHAGKSGRLWTVEETHPYMLFLQRWWLTGQAVWRGYNVLSLDTDLPPRHKSARDALICAVRTLRRHHAAGLGVACRGARRGPGTHRREGAARQRGALPSAADGRRRRRRRRRARLRLRRGAFAAAQHGVCLRPGVGWGGRDFTPPAHLQPVG